jgi:hypothetical protein
MDSLSTGYAELMASGASENHICDFLDKHLGVNTKFGSIEWQSDNSITFSSGVVCDRKTGKVIGYIGKKGATAAQPVERNYCKNDRCAELNCWQHE